MVLNLKSFLFLPLMSFYQKQANINQAALIVQILGQKAMTMAQINTKLAAQSAPVVNEAYLTSAARLGWLLLQPYNLWQANLNMDTVNGQNRLISSLVPGIIPATWENEQPSSYVGGLGTAYSKALQQIKSGSPITLYGNRILPGTPVVNDALILAPNPRVV